MFCLSLHYNGTNILQGMIKSSVWICIIMEQIVIYLFICHFSVDYNDAAVDDILDIHKYLMKKMR